MNFIFRNLVHNLSLTDLTEQQRLTWYSSDTDVKMCVVKGKDEENCQNYVRILAKTSASNLLVCATNAFKPMCRDYIVHSGNYTMASEKAGQALCPYDPQQNSTFVHVDGELYTGTVADFSGMDPIIYREPLQTEQYDSMSLNGKNLFIVISFLSNIPGCTFTFHRKLKRAELFFFTRDWTRWWW